MQPPELSPPPVARIAWVDVAKGLGILLVFHGHLVERFIEAGVPAALSQMKWIYSFHMPLFFVLVGLVYRDRPMSLRSFLGRELRSRLIPAWAFNLVGTLFWVRAQLAAPDFGYLGDHSWVELLQYCGTRAALETLSGKPTWNILTWFLICLFVVELWHFLLRRLVSRLVPLVLSIMLFATLTAGLGLYGPVIEARIGSALGWWHVSSAVAAMVFYQLGILMQRLGLVAARCPGARACVLAAVYLAITLLTYDRNQLGGNHVVMVAGGLYGHVGWFFVTNLSQVLAGSRVLNYLGQITLALMCLDGLLHDYVNPAAMSAVCELIPKPGLLLFSVVAVLGTAISVAICVPITWILQRYAPWLLGRTAASGPAAAVAKPPGDRPTSRRPGN
jgi:acyltransferase